MISTHTNDNVPLTILDFQRLNVLLNEHLKNLFIHKNRCRSNDSIIECENYINEYRQLKVRLYELECLLYPSNNELPF